MGWEGEEKRNGDGRELKVHKLTHRRVTSEATTESTGAPAILLI